MSSTLLYCPSSVRAQEWSYEERKPRPRFETKHGLVRLSPATARFKATRLAWPD